MALVGIAGALPPGSSRAHTHPTYDCQWPSTGVPVYFNPGVLAAWGYDVNAMREGALNTLALWNEEANADLWLYYASDTTLEEIAGAIVIRHKNHTSDCELAAGRANWTPRGPGTCQSAWIDMYMEYGCPGDPAYAGPTNLSLDWATGGALYEDVLSHEIGHAAYGFPHSGADSVMSTAGSSGVNALHLYSRDVHTATLDEGVTFRRPATTVSTDNGATWSWPTYFSSMYYGTIAPSVDTRIQDGRIELALPAPYTAGVDSALWRGTPGSWTWVPHPTHMDAITSWVSVAQSDYGETLVVWPDNCTSTNGCDIEWAWSTTEGGTWTVGTLPLGDEGTLSKPEVAYDRDHDLFALFYINHKNVRIFSTHTPAVSSPVWTPSVQASTARIRFLGGVVFNHVVGSNQGLLVAAYWNYPAVPLYEITQANVSLTGGGYVLGPFFYMSSSYVGQYRTRRPFGIARRRDTNTIVVAWRGIPYTTDPMMVATKTSLSAGVPFSAPVAELAWLRHGVDVAYSPYAGAFVAGVTW